MALKATVKKRIFSLVPFSLIHWVKKKISFSYWLFGKAKKNTGNYILLETNARFTMYGMEEQLGAEVTNGFKNCYNGYEAREGFLRKYILEIDNCVIEPEYGWGIMKKPGTLIFDSISNNAWIESYHPDYFRYKKNMDKAITHTVFVSLCMIKGGENNYWHFLHDLLGAVALAKSQLPANIPFLITKNLAERPFFKAALLQSHVLANSTWIIRDKEYHFAEKAYFIQTMPNSNEQFFNVRDLLDVPISDNSANRKIFLTRNNKRIRFLNNSSEIETIARSYGFEIVDTDTISLQEQIKIFSETKYLVGIHGAGLTNVLYRKNAPMFVLELLPLDYLQPHYFWLSKGMGHGYSCIVGSASIYNTSFSVHPKDFEEKLKVLLEK